MGRRAGLGISGQLVLLRDNFLFALLKLGTLLVLSYINNSQISYGAKRTIAS